MEVYAEQSGGSMLLQNKMNKDKEIQSLCEIHANLNESANYLIQLFYKTEKKYSCSRTKIGKLLSIVAFIYAKNGKKLFDEIILKYDNCGTSINELKSFVDRDVYIQFQYADDCQYIDDEFNNNELVLEKHKESSSIDENLKSEIENVFRNFGSFSAYHLGQFINPIVNLPQMVNENNEIQLHMIPTINVGSFSDEILNEKNNVLVKLLFSNGGVNGNTAE